MKILPVFLFMLLVSCCSKTPSNKTENPTSEDWAVFISSIRVGEDFIIPDVPRIRERIQLVQSNEKFDKYFINTDYTHNDMYVCVANGKVISIWAEKRFGRYGSGG